MRCERVCTLPVLRYGCQGHLGFMSPERGRVDYCAFVRMRVRSRVLRHERTELAPSICIVGRHRYYGWRRLISASSRAAWRFCHGDPAQMRHLRSTVAPEGPKGSE
jgi:hypothetical protein